MKRVGGGRRILLPPPAARSRRRRRRRYRAACRWGRAGVGVSRFVAIRIPWIRPPTLTRPHKGGGKLFISRVTVPFLVSSPPAFGRPALDETALSAIMVGLGPTIHESAGCRSRLLQVQSASRRLVRRNSWMPGPRPGMTQCGGAQTTSPVPVEPALFLPRHRGTEEKKRRRAMGRAVSVVFFFRVSAVPFS